MKINLQASKRLRLLPFWVLMIASLSGCATRQIWEGPLLDTFHEPANPSRLGVYHVPEKADYLVQFDDLSPSGDLPASKVYYAKVNHTETSAARKPQFVPLAEVGKGVLLPVFQHTNTPASSIKQPRYVLQKNNQQFAIYDEAGSLIGEYDLPTYPTSVGTVKRVLLTPLTLTLDATIIGGWLFREFAPVFLGVAQSIH